MPKFALEAEYSDINSLEIVGAIERERSPPLNKILDILELTAARGHGKMPEYELEGGKLLS